MGKIKMKKKLKAKFKHGDIVDVDYGPSGKLIGLVSIHSA